MKQFVHENLLLAAKSFNFAGEDRNALANCCLSLRAFAKKSFGTNLVQFSLFVNHTETRRH